MMVCVKCGHQTRDVLNKCPACKAPFGAALPGSLQAEEIEYCAERVSEFQQAADRILSEEWSVDQFLDYLEGQAECFFEYEEAIRGIQIPHEAIEDFRDELQRGFKGLALYQEGINTMKLFVDTQDTVYLEDGIELVRQGNDLLNDAIRINFQQRQKHEELYLDSSGVM